MKPKIKSKVVTKVEKKLPLHQAIATGQNPKNYKGAKSGFK